MALFRRAPCLSFKPLSTFACQPNINNIHQKTNPLRYGHTRKATDSRWFGPTLIQQRAAFSSRTGVDCDLLQDVTGGNTDYKAILVYDVSRWGRFQDTDEAAHYEFLCKSAGVPIHYCAETFANDGSLPSSIMKTLKRVMAGEFSRELGVKVIAGQKRLAQLGFKQGGIPGYGLRRLLVSENRIPKQLLAHGETKSISTDRVILVSGPACEIDEVREIFRKFTVNGMSFKAI